MNKTEEERRKKKTKKWYISYIVLKILTTRKKIRLGKIWSHFTCKMNF